MSVACVLQFQYQRTNTICEKNKEALRHDIIIFSHWTISSPGSFLASEIFTMYKIHCNYPLTTMQGDRFASCENIGSRYQTSSLPPGWPAPSQSGSLIGYLCLDKTVSVPDYWTNHNKEFNAAQAVRFVRVTRENRKEMCGAYTIHCTLCRRGCLSNICGFNLGLFLTSF